LYKRIVLAYDGSLEGRNALREGVLLGQRSKAELFLFAVAPAVSIAGAEVLDAYDEILRDGIAKAKELGVTLSGHMAYGDPVAEISAFAKKVGADLVVVSHRRKSLLERWWTGSDQGYLSDRLDCSLLISKKILDNEVFADLMKQAEAVADK
jgi:nucleotide-binding universal stress UspA family protein